MICLMIITLYTSRVILDKLGIEDYGIYNVVAGFVSMLGFFSSSLANVSQRFISIALGHNNLLRAQQIYNQHLLLYGLLVLLLLLVGETLGVFIIKTQLVIPSGRTDAALWAFHFALISLSLTLLGTVNNSSIIAHEDMKVYSFVGVVEGLSKLSIAFVLSLVNLDRLTTYSFLLMIVVLLVQAYYALYCHRKYKECSFLWFWDRRTIRETFSFISWNFIGTIIYILKDQGVNVLLNIFCGPIVNAARAISYQINTAICNFNSSFTTSVQPQIVKSYGSGDFGYVKKLFFNSSRYSLLIMWTLCLPVFFYIDELLALWLKVVPEYTSLFTKWVLIDSILATMTNAPWFITLAMGNLRRYVLYCNTTLLLIFPLVYFSLRLGMHPLSAFIIIVIVRNIQIIVILYVLNSQFKYGINAYLIAVVWPAFKIVLASLLIATLAITLLEEYPLLSFVVITLSSLSLTWIIGVSSDEKKFIVNMLKTKIVKML